MNLIKFCVCVFHIPDDVVLLVAVVDIATVLIIVDHDCFRKYGERFLIVLAIVFKTSH